MALPSIARRRNPTNPARPSSTCRSFAMMTWLSPGQWMPQIGFPLRNEVSTCRGKFLLSIAHTNLEGAPRLSTIFGSHLTSGREIPHPGSGFPFPMARALRRPLRATSTHRRRAPYPLLGNIGCGGISHRRPGIFELNLGSDDQSLLIRHTLPLRARARLHRRRGARWARLSRQDGPARSCPRPVFTPSAIA